MTGDATGPHAPLATMPPDDMQDCATEPDVWEVDGPAVPLPLAPSTVALMWRTIDSILGTIVLRADDSQDRVNASNLRVELADAIRACEDKA